MRRAKVFTVTPATLMSIITEGGSWSRCIEGVPKGARLMGAAWDCIHHCFDVVVEHESFREVREGEEPLRFQPVIAYRTEAPWREKIDEVVNQ